MNVENNNTAEPESEQTDHGNNIITIQTTLGDEDEDVHKCGRCKAEFSTLEAFIQHKVHQTCARVPDTPARRKKPRGRKQEVSVDEASTAEVSVDGQSSDEPDRSSTNAEAVEVRSSRRRRQRGAAAAKAEERAEERAEATDATDASPSPDGAEDTRTLHISSTRNTVYKVNGEGRYVCDLCDKTFKTTNILRAHMITHSGMKNFPCELCGSAFRTKGSLIRHNRRHTDERPYRCSLCGLSFRESGALTRHLKSITPCTDKIRFTQYKEILVGMDGVQKGVETSASAPLAGQQEVDEQQLEEEEEARAAVVSVEEEGEEPVEEEEEEPVEEEEEEPVEEEQPVIQEVTFMEVEAPAQEQQLTTLQSQSAELVVEGDRLICQAIINSGIALATEAELRQVKEEEPEEEEGGGEGEEEEVEEEELKEALQAGDAEGRMTEIQVTEECVEMEAEETLDASDREDEDQPSARTHKCPHCNRAFKGLNYLRFHVKGHLGYKPFRCVMCQKEFVTGYLLKKHMEVHLSERRYKCGECGKLYKTIGHVREHMRAHSDDRPYHCNKCDKGYKTKNALQVHQRTHAQEKPYVCQFCLRGFREKGSLVRHIRHHTGEKPYKCPKCGRGFAEHGTLNRHMRAKGGCFAGQKDVSGEAAAAAAAEEEEDQASAESLAAAARGSEDPHAVLVEFSSVADSQEYILRSPAGEVEPVEEVTVIQDGQNQMGNHIIKVVRQIVSQSRGGVGAHHQIILRSVTLHEDLVSVSDGGDTITIATPESLTEQVAMTLASAISDGTLLETPAAGAVAVVTAEAEAGRELEVLEVVQQQEEEEEAEEFVITSPEEVEIHTVIV